MRQHIDNHPDRSLGIIAFSESQQQEILLEIQRFREENPKCEAFFAEDKEDEFFVKNLENVQGMSAIPYSLASVMQKQKSKKPMGNLCRYRLDHYLKAVTVYRPFKS